jgi:hypothetical protein
VLHLLLELHTERLELAASDLNIFSSLFLTLLCYIHHSSGCNYDINSHV